jgi:hypothetical protein
MPGKKKPLVGKKKGTSKKVDRLTGRGLAIDNLVQRVSFLELASFHQPTASQAAKSAAVLHVLTALLIKLAPNTEAKLGLDGNLHDDYHFDENDFPPFLRKVATQLLHLDPPYVFDYSPAELTKKYLHASVIALATAIDADTH